MRNRRSALLRCVSIAAVLSAGCSEQTQTQSQNPSGDKPPPVYAGGSTTPPKTASGQPVKNPKVLNMTPNARVVP
jgi:hypothetical protein